MTFQWSQSKLFLSFKFYLQTPLLCFMSWRKEQKCGICLPYLWSQCWQTHLSCLSYLHRQWKEENTSTNVIHAIYLKLSLLWDESHPTDDYKGSHEPCGDWAFRQSALDDISSHLEYKNVGSFVSQIFGSHSSKTGFKDLQGFCKPLSKSSCKSWDVISFRKFWLSYCPKPLNQAYYTKTSPWGTSHSPSHIQHPAGSSHSLLGIDVLKNAVMAVKLPVLYENFL